ncbi:hypothetical protein SAMN05421823_105180 [Catalinimonas alkaloidigena]|uniref:Uncharacterized protein n=1 Tax=Catalinimonas alkaloidigena TaxID=1075417 RepID=A0A1G9J272_9BACT|nr:hypothetical protein [Catalinimonas alkaloidigena]SDL31607.1 hypothetical protein SAMN05421823_105180 [Catalinimonas alkaloidigena]
MRRFLPLCLLCLFYGAVSAQDVIYETDGSKVLCQIVGMEPDFIKFKKLDNLSGPNYAVEKSRLLMAFSESGSYVVFDQDGKDYTNAESLEAFVSNKPANAFDLMVTQQKEVIAGTIRDSTEQELIFERRGRNGVNAGIQSVAKDQLLAVIYHDGKHRFWAAPTVVSDALKGVSAQIAEVVPGAPNGQTDVLNPPATKEVNGEFTRVEFEEFKNKALLKTEELAGYMQTIVSQDVTSEESNKAIDLAVGLFLSEESQVEITNAYDKSNKIVRKIRDYLRKLKLLGEQYDKVKISWSDISYVSDLRKGADGNYYGVVTVQQKFEGFSEGKLVYSDITQKNIEVVLKGYQKVAGGVTQDLWDVFLSNIGVVETRKI